jgi:uncharacterized protein YbjT (DUF2867 family)
MKILIAGSTGLVGGKLLELSCADSRIESITSLVRRASAKTHPKVTEVVADFKHLLDVESHFRVDAVFCCLGTTIRKAGSKDAFFEVDYEFPSEMARLSRRQGVHSFSVITAIGADSKSLFFYNRVKGQLEDMLENAGLEAVFVHRPAGIMGERNENRPMEKIANTVLSAISPIMVGSLKNIIPVTAERIAEEMLKNVFSGKPGFHRIESVSYQ